MTIAMQKKLLWIAFAVTLQTWMFVFLSLALHLIFYRGPTTYPASIVTLAVLAMPCTEIVRTFLMDCYRREPPAWTGRWQLALSDLILISLFGAITMAVARRLDTDAFFLFGLPFVLTLTVEFALAMLFTERIGFPSKRLRVVMALCMVVGTVGATIMTGVVLISCAFVHFYRR